MKCKGLIFVAVLLCCLAGVRAATPQSSTDLWDLSQGTVVTATSGTYDSIDSLGMFGGAGYGPEAGTTVFGGGSPQFVEWKTHTAVTVNQLRLFSRGDGDGTFRTFSQFTVKIKSSGSSTFDQTVFTWNPHVPFTILDTSSWMILDTNVTAFTAREFRAEFTMDDGGSRVMELDAFGSIAPTGPSIDVAPVSKTVWAGDTAIFTVSASGDAPLSYTWKHEETNVVADARVQISTDGKLLSISNAVPSDAGKYTILVSNTSGQAQSDANLTVQVDSAAPSVVISSPQSGAITSSRVTLAGTVSDNRAVSLVTWQRNGVDMSSIPAPNGYFSISTYALPGETHFKVIATDADGNVGSAEVVVTLPPASPTAQSSDDLWDISRGTIVTAESATFPEANGPGIFGGGGFVSEDGDTIFADDQPNGYVHFVEWKTTGPVTVSTVRLFAHGDGQIYSYGREMGRFTLKTKSSPTSGFDTTVFTYVPPHPYVFLDSDSGLILETNLPAFTAQEFRGEFEQANLRAEGWNAPRVYELDAFGPGAGGPPQIVNQPLSTEVVNGGAASFRVGVIGSAPLSFQWSHAGTNLTESAKFVGVNSWTLTVMSAAADDAGDYSVNVKNGAGEATSTNATLSVRQDTVPPVVTITSPVGGTQSGGSFTLAGTVTDDNSVAAVTWELNGHAMGTLSLAGGAFSLPAQSFTLGDNVIKVTATDLSGNTNFATVTASWIIPRLLSLDGTPSGQDGSRISVPVTLVSTGSVSGATFLIGFNTNYLADPQFDWSPDLASAFTSVNIVGRTNRATFAFPGTSLAAGSVQIGTISFRARSVSTNITTSLSLVIEEIASDSGDPFTTGNFAHGASLKIMKRKIVGDNNANNRLDVGDASVIMRFVSQLDIPRPWDTSLNDVNKSFSLDSGDVIKVLRAVVGIDPQPVVPAGLKAGDGGGGAGGITLVVDKPMAKPGDKVTVEARVSGQSKPISGASFRLEYPVAALRLDNSTAHQVGPIASASGALLAWNVSPNVSDYTVQNGAISLGVSSATTWPTNNGVLARFTFTVQAAAPGRYSWPIQIKNLEVTHDGFETEVLGAASMNFVARESAPASFDGASIHFGANGAASLMLQGDLGATYVVQGSSDLTSWKVIGTYTTTTTGAIQVDDPDATGATARFYKATLVQ